MGSLSSYIINPVTQKELKRLRFHDLYKNEKDLDTLVIEHCKLLADLLIENKLLQPGSELKFIGAQFQHVDLLFAEVDEEQDLRRLVLVEDKLLTNPAAKRSVIGQIIGYAASFSTVRAGKLAAKFPDHKQWIDDNADVLDRQLERGDFLLVVCGDSIHSNVADIIRRLASGADRHPTSGMELCLVAMDLFGDDTQHYLIPHLVGRVREATRQLRITVQNTHGDALPTTVEIQEPIHNEQNKKSSTNRADRTPEEFFAKMWARRFGQQPVDDCEQFLEAIKDASIPGLSMVPGSSGKPGLQLQSTLLDGRILPILHVRGRQPAIIDSMQARIWEDAMAVRARADFRKALLAIGGTSNAKDQVMILTKVLNAATGDIIAALQRLSKSLKGA